MKKNLKEITRINGCMILINAGMRNRQFILPLNLCLKGYSEVAKVLLEKGAWVNLQESKGGSSLIMAGQEGHTEVAKLLLE